MESASAPRSCPFAVTRRCKAGHTNPTLRSLSHEAADPAARRAQTAHGADREFESRAGPRCGTAKRLSLSFPLDLPSLERRAQDQARKRRTLGPELVAAEWRDVLESGLVPNRATLARRMGVSRAHVTWVLGIGPMSHCRWNGYRSGLHPWRKVRAGPEPLTFLLRRSHPRARCSSLRGPTMCAATAPVRR